MTAEEIAALVKKEVEGIGAGLLDKLGGTFKAQIEAAVKPLAEQIKPLADNQKVLADTIAAIPPAAAKPATDKTDKGQAGDGLTADAVAKLIADALGKHQATQQESAARAAARSKVIAAKLKDVPEAFLAALPDSADEKVLAEAADKLVAGLDAAVKAKVPNLGGGDGGQPNGGAPVPTPPAKGGFLKMAGAAPAAA